MNQITGYSYGICQGFHILTLLANWLKLVCFNFPFAFFTQMFFIQPLVRVIFKTIFASQIKARADEFHEKEAKGEMMRPASETEAIADIFRRIDEIQDELAHEHRRRKSMESDLEHEHRRRKSLEKEVHGRKS